MTHADKVRQWIPSGTTGVEIGPGVAPIAGFDPAPIYVDCFKDFGPEPCRADYYGDACSLPFHSNSLDYVASSHVLEHVANPVTALAEWYRVLRPGGIIYLVVPDRRATWDRARELTTVEHILDDYVHGTTASDATHIDEFLDRVNWSEWQPSVAPDEIPARRAEMRHVFHGSVAAGLPINIHFHTFEPANLRELFETLRTWPKRRFNWEIVDEAEYFPACTPNGVFVAVRVHKGWLDRAQADAFDVTADPDRRTAVVRPEAIRWEDFVRAGSST